MKKLFFIQMMAACLPLNAQVVTEASSLNLIGKIIPIVIFGRLLCEEKGRAQICIRC